MMQSCPQPSKNAGRGFFQHLAAIVFPHYVLQHSYIFNRAKAHDMR